MTALDRDALEEAWDQGNATGLDGWIGPGRGAGDIDPEAIAARRRDVDRILERLRPVDGVILTRDEAATAATVMQLARGRTFTGDLHLLQATYRKLKATS